MQKALLATLFVLVAVVPAMAQDPVTVDAKHYKVEFENDHVRVLRATYGPHEKSVMHDHPANTVVFVTDANAKVTGADGKAQVAPGKAGMVMWDAGGKHLPENLSDKAFELIIVETKGRK